MPASSAPRQRPAPWAGRAAPCRASPAACRTPAPTSRRWSTCRSCPSCAARRSATGRRARRAAPGCASAPRRMLRPWSPSPIAWSSAVSSSTWSISVWVACADEVGVVHGSLRALPFRRRCAARRRRTRAARSSSTLHGSAGLEASPPASRGRRAPARCRASCTWTQVRSLRRSMRRTRAAGAAVEPRAVAGAGARRARRPSPRAPARRRRERTRAAARLMRGEPSRDAT